ncbi:hypothetical protein [Pedobacter sp. Leaf176]|uniref:hypothetical protein n=1 Tax=Pedobacter sp. Leaf176 TaxID=1736286 RepID=UPI0006FF4C2C|nr:hypothetical protein [Pedobacter sp. Leaf176]KQR71308.1 hypothetical protein ASF92_07940 [Pedobacter sp. Leaf176]
MSILSSKTSCFKTTWVSIFGMIMLTTLSLTVIAQGNRNIEYYTSIFPELDGKIKSIDGMEIEYYISVFSETNGKVRSIGGTRIDYYVSVFPETNGKIKSIGDDYVEYYISVFPEHNGKIKSIGNIKFEYHTSALQNNGRLKSITNPYNDNHLLDTYDLVRRLNSKRQRIR